MADIVTPSTGASRPGGNFRLNVHRIQPGERILSRSGLSGWRIDTAFHAGEFEVVVTPSDVHGMPVHYSDIIGVVPPGTDEVALLLNVKALVERGDKEIEKARKAKHDAVWALLDVVMPDRKTAILRL